VILLSDNACYTVFTKSLVLSLSTSSSTTGSTRSIDQLPSSLSRDTTGGECCLPPSCNTSRGSSSRERRRMEPATGQGRIHFICEIRILNAHKARHSRVGREAGDSDLPTARP